MVKSVYAISSTATRVKRTATRLPAPTRKRRTAIDSSPPGLSSRSSRSPSSPASCFSNAVDTTAGLLQRGRRLFALLCLSLRHHQLRDSGADKLSTYARRPPPVPRPVARKMSTAPYSAIHKELSTCDFDDFLPEFANGPMVENVRKKGQSIASASTASGHRTVEYTIRNTFAERTR